MLQWSVEEEEAAGEAPPSLARRASSCRDSPSPLQPLPTSALAHFSSPSLPPPTQTAMEAELGLGGWGGHRKRHCSALNSWVWAWVCGRMLVEWLH